MRAAQPVACQRGVGGDDAAQAGRQGDLGDFRQGVIGQVGGDLEEHRNGARQRGAHRHHTRQQGREGGSPLQVAQALGIGGGHVDGGKIHLRPAERQHLRKIRGTVSAVLVCAQVQAHGQAARALRQPGTDRLGPVIVEAKAVDGGAVFGQAEQARARVAGLRARGGCPHFQKAEARTGQGGQGGCVLVIARR